MGRATRHRSGPLALGLTLLLAAAVGACGDSSDTATPAGASAGGGGGTGVPGSNGFTQPGAQDFGQFRQILDDGGIPGPSTLDPLGFFAEHKLDYPAADCGHDVCMHANLAVAGNLITGTGATVLHLGLNSPLSPDDLERPPLHVVLALDTSGSMDGEPLLALQSGLTRMLEYLEPEDHVTLVAYSDTAKVVVEHGSMDEKAAIQKEIDALHAGGATNIYDGLFTAYQIAGAHAAPGTQSRVILLSDGMATSGIKSPAKLRSLAAAWAAKGVATTTIGVGVDFDPEVMRSIAEVGSGAFYFAEDPLAVKEIFTEEVQTFLVPAALDVRIEVALADGYDAAEAYGTKGWSGADDGGVISIPALFLAGRKTSGEPVDGGRRGGGGAILVRLVPTGGEDNPDDPTLVAQLWLRWTDPATGEPRQQVAEVHNEHDPGVVPDGGYFSGKTVEKAFVMLNVLVGLQMACASAAAGSPETAHATLTALRTSAAAWNEEYLDPDIAADVEVLDQFLTNLETVAPPVPMDAPEPWLGYYY